MAIAALLRIAAATGDLYIDEIWTWWFVKHVTPTLGSIFFLRHDNNHILNTLVMFLLGPDVPGGCYRLLPVGMSIGTVWLAGRIAHRHGGLPAQRTAWLLIGGAYLLILYGSEARGYAYAVFFAFLSWESLQRTAESRRWSDAAVFAVSCSLGFLAHLTFVYCYAGFFLWTLWSWWKKPSWVIWLAQLLPMLTAAWLQVFFIGGIINRPMAIGGGPESHLFSALIATLSLTAGGPLTGDVALIAALLVLLLIGNGLFRLWQTEPSVAVCYATTIFVAPAAVLLATGHALIYPRYFLVPVSFALLVIGHGMAGWWQANRTTRISLVSFLTIFLILNGWWTARLINHGRGDYSHALTWMTAQIANGTVTVGSDHDFRNGLIVMYYQPRLGPDVARLQYLEPSRMPPAGTDWFIVHNFEGDEPFPAVLLGPFGNTYQLERTFRYGSLSGYNWWLYRRVTH